MEEFTSDLIAHIENYYNAIIRITPKIGLAVIAFIIAWFIASKIQQIAGAKLKSKMHDPLLAIFISRLIRMVLLLIGLLIVLRIVGLTGIATSLLAGAGISAFVIGFALKDIGENFLAGILLAFKRPFHIGEIIESNGVKGKVVSLNLRDTQILSDGKNIYLPNALLIKSPLTNYTRDHLLSQDLIVGLEYGADYQRAIEIVTQTLCSIPGVLDDERKSSVLVSGISTNSVLISINYWVRTDGEFASGEIKSEVIIKILQALDNAGYNIPANIVEIKKYEKDVYNNNEAENFIEDGKRQLKKPE